MLWRSSAQWDSREQETATQAECLLSPHAGARRPGGQARVAALGKGHVWCPSSPLSSVPGLYPNPSPGPSQGGKQPSGLPGYANRLHVSLLRWTKTLPERTTEIVATQTSWPQGNMDTWDQEAYLRHMHGQPSATGTVQGIPTSASWLLSSIATGSCWLARLWSVTTEGVVSPLEYLWPSLSQALQVALSGELRPPDKRATLLSPAGLGVLPRAFIH